MGYNIHPSKMVCSFDFLVIFCSIIVIFSDFHAFGHPRCMLSMKTIPLWMVFVFGVLVFK